MGSPEERKGGIGSGMVLTFTILLLHILMVLLLGVAVVFFRGVVDYFAWILFGGLFLIGLSGYLFFRRLRRDNRRLRDVLNDPALKGRSLEISFLGGLASVRVGAPGETSSMIEAFPAPPLIEDPESVRLREIARLVRMLEKGQISREEYEQLKEEVLDRGHRSPLMSIEREAGPPNPIGS